MRRRWKILLCALCVPIALVVVYFFCLREKEPVYNGKRLSEWLERYRPISPYNNRQAHSISRALEAKDAVKAIGTNAIPILLRWSEASPSRLQSQQIPIERIFGFGRLSQSLAAIQWNWSSVRKRRLARIGFEILKSDASCALPGLAQHFESTHDKWDAGFASQLIGSLGTTGLDYFIGYIRRGGTNIQRELAIARIGEMGYLGTNAAVAVPLLLEIAQSDPMSTSAIASLGELCLDPDHVIPLLVEKTRSRDKFERFTALESLENFGPKAKAAGPQLRALLLHDDLDTRRGATNALHAIIPETFTNTAVRDRYE